MTPKQGLAYVKRHGIVLQAARGPVPNLAERIAGEPIHGSWWGHPKGKEIYRVADAISESDEILVCRLIEGKVTFVHRRLWPALVKLAGRFPRKHLAKIWEEHTKTGAHRSRSLAFPQWVPGEVLSSAEALSLTEADLLLGLQAPRGQTRRDAKSSRHRPRADATRTSYPSSRPGSRKRAPARLRRRK
jgi:hypothetical protein